ncbi:MAG TPA: CBS domain-containing protein [Gemmatimonadaceae bacterium]|nr:CBS domain-containing protein [Gemmatimonadaceae bacterium]
MSSPTHLDLDGARRYRDESDVRPLGEIMQTRVVTIGPKESATAAWTRMRRRGIRHLVVTDHERLVGVLSERDLGGRTGARLREGRSVRDLMTRRVLRAEPNTTLRDAADQMRARLIGSLPVVEGERLVGIVTATDVFDAIGPDRMAPMSGAERQLLRAPTSSKSLGGRTIPRTRRTATKSPRRDSQSHKREPFAGHVPRPAKRNAGRTTGPHVPANVRVSGVQLDEDERAYIRTKLGMKLGKLASAIERVSVRVKDVNGPRGGVDHICRVKVVLSGFPSVVFESRAASTRDAINGALTGAERAVRRVVRRARMKPLKAAARRG